MPHNRQYDHPDIWHALRLVTSDDARLFGILKKMKMADWRDMKSGLCHILQHTKLMCHTVIQQL